MYDDLHNPDEARTDLGFPPSASPSSPSTSGAASGGQSAPAADREVPLPAGVTPALLHQWLDGEVQVAMMQSTPGGNETVDLWNRIHDEAETLRSRTTPLYVHKRIMESLPDDAYRLNQPWYRRAVLMNPAVLLVAAIALVAFGAAVAHVAFR